MGKPVGNSTLVKKICCEDEKWMELAEDCVHWQAIVLEVLNFKVLVTH